jgi:hypothetical protein
MQQVLVFGSSPVRMAQFGGVGSYSTPFSHASDAWIWALGALVARRDGQAKRERSGVARPCDPEDVVKCIDQLCKNGRIGLEHIRVLAKWGQRSMSPSKRCVGEAREAHLWDEALVWLDVVLRRKGIVA